MQLKSWDLSFEWTNSVEKEEIVETISFSSFNNIFRSLLTKFQTYP